MKKILFVLSLLPFFACNPTSKSETTQSGNDLRKAVEWVSYSAEYEAMCLQVYNWAYASLETSLANASASDLPPAIVLDVDETVLDNSDYEWFLIRNGKSYESETWKQWTDSAKAKAVPGSRSFLYKADSLGVAIFLISNRKTGEINSTQENLAKLGYPAIPLDHYLFKEDESSKTTRRNVVWKNYHIVQFLGDNLDDFDSIFEMRDKNHGKEAVTKNAEAFGTRFFLLPNPMYGSWEQAIH